MKGYNKVIIAGNLARDSELRYTVNQRAFLRFTVAINHRFKNNAGEDQEITDFISVVAWGAIGENVAKYLRKGSPVLVEGRLRSGSYEKNGVKHYTTDVQADNIILLGSGSGSSSGNYNSQPQSQTQARNNNPKGDVYISPMPGGDFGGFNDDNFGGDFSRGFDDLNSGFGGFDPKNNDVNNNDDGDSESNLPF